MIRRRRSAGHGSLRTITPTRAAFARPGPGGYPFPGVIARMQPSDSLIPIGLGSGRPLPSAYPSARATRSNEGLPGVRAVLFQRAVVVDPAGCGALLAHGAGTAVAFRLHEALGTQEDVVSRLQGLRPTRSRTYASATALPRSPQGSLPAWVGWPLTGRGSHPLDDTQGFMTYSSIPLDRPAWPHHATTPQIGGAGGRHRREALTSRPPPDARTTCLQKAISRSTASETGPRLSPRPSSWETATTHRKHRLPSLCRLEDPNCPLTSVRIQHPSIDLLAHEWLRDAWPNRRGAAGRRTWASSPNDDLPRAQLRVAEGCIAGIEGSEDQLALPAGRYDRIRPPAEFLA